MMLDDELYGLALWESTTEGQAVGHAYGSDDSTLPPLETDLADYLNWPSVASTVYSKLYQIAAFDPSVSDFNEASFAKLQRSFATSPYWNGDFLVTSREVPLHDRDYRAAVEAVDALCQGAGVSRDISQLIVKNIRRIAQLASTPDGQASDLDGSSRKQTLFHNATLAITSGALRVLFMSAVVPLQMDRSRDRFRVEDQDIQINLARGVLNFDFCKRHARRILGYGKVSVETWESMAAANHEPESAGEGWPEALQIVDR